MFRDLIVISQWLVLVCKLFKGRLVDKRESSMSPIEATSRGCDAGRHSLGVGGVEVVI